MPAMGPCDQSWASNGSSVVVLLLAVFLLVFAVYLLDRRWRAYSLRMAEATGVNRYSHAYSVNLVRNLMPSFNARKYQFRGMQVKKEAVSIKFEDLSLELPCGRTVLNGITGECKPGRLFAIMGPSGAGKTTFMNVLSGKATYGKMGGSISINGRLADFADFKSTTGFVPQDDIVHEDLTVREQIQFSARLRNSVHVSKRRIERITEDVLNIMQILHIQNSIVGSVEKRGISGGERKRVNMGLELAAQPTVLFLDEPTSGLDATSSLSVASSLKTMCLLGMTSVMVIHQPRYSLFQLFDDVLLLGKGGRMAYLGPSMGVKPYFESLGFAMPRDENPADWFMDVICGEVKNALRPVFSPESLFEEWEKGQRSEESECQTIMLRAAASRSLDQDDQHAVLTRALEEQWDRVDVSCAGEADASRFAELLAHCSCLVPDAGTVRELMDRMSGKDAAVVRKQHFVSYVCSLGEAIAEDQALAEGSFQVPQRRPWPLATLFSGGVGPSDADGSEEAGDLEAPIESSSEAVSDPGAGRKNSISSFGVAGHRAPGFLRQLQTLYWRRLIQWWRMSRQRALFLAALTFGAMFLGLLDTFVVPKAQWDAVPALYLHTTLALLLAIFSLHVFGHGQCLFWRERASGLNVFAFFEARVHVNALDLLVQTVLFTAVYFLVRQPCVPYWRFLVPFLFTAYAAAGWGYFISALVPPRHGPFMVALVIFITCGLLGEPGNLQTFLQDGAPGYAIASLSITRWTVGMSFSYGFHHLNPDPAGLDLKERALLQEAKNVYLPENELFGPWWGPACASVVMGTVLQVLSYLCLRLQSRRNGSS